VGVKAQVEGAKRRHTDSQAALLDGDERSSADAAVVGRHIGQHQAEQRHEHEGLTEPRHYQGRGEGKEADVSPPPGIRPSRGANRRTSRRLLSLAPQSSSSSTNP
jgi:hypothetical protein